MMAPYFSPSSSRLSTPVRVAFLGNAFLACASFMIVMPSIWPYIHQMNGSRSFLAFVIASYSLGEAVGAFMAGTAYPRWSPKVLLVGSVVLSAVGAGLYAIASVLPATLNLWSVLVARFVQGIGSGAQQAVEQSFLGEFITPSKRTAATSELSSWAMGGFLAGPVLGVLLSFLHLSLWGHPVDPNSYPAILIFICVMIMLLLTATCFSTPSRRSLVSAEPLLTFLLPKPSSTSLHHEGHDDDDYDNKDTNTYSQKSGGSVAVLMGIFFVHFIGFAIIETLCTPLVVSEFNWGLAQSFLLFLLSSLISLIAMVALQCSLSYWFSDSALLLASLVVSLGSFAVMAPDLHSHLGPVRYVVGFCLESASFPVGKTLSLSLMTKVLEGSPSQSYTLGLAFAVGALARIVGPFIAIIITPTLLFALTTSCFTTVAVVQYTCLPHIPQHDEDDDEDGASTGSLE